MNKLRHCRAVKAMAPFKWRRDQKSHDLRTGWKRGLLGLLLGVLLAGPAFGQEMVFFGTDDPGEYKGLDLWGLDTAWLDARNVFTGVNFMGQPQVDLIRFSFTGDTPIIGGDLTGAGLTEFYQRMAIVNNYCDSHTALYLNNDTDDWNTNPYLVTPYADGVDAYKWAELIDVTAQKCVAAGRDVLSVSIFNEPDHGHWQGDVNRFGDVCWQLRWSGAFPAFDYGAADFIRIMGANTLNNDVARSWGYDQLNTWGFLEEGNTHQLAGNMWSYIDFYETVQANGDVGANDELHNVMEAMVGAEYGMDVGIWWGPAEYARGEFVKASDGDRLAYAENRPYWTAASVYRAPDGKIQAFVGESERQARPTVYRFFSNDRPVFYDGHGPQRAYDVKTRGGFLYQAPHHNNAERVVNITWGEDVQPAIDGSYVLVNRASGKVMEFDELAGSWWGANIQQNAFDGESNQQWNVHPVRRDIGGDNSYFEFTNVRSGQSAQIDWWSITAGDTVFQWGTGPYPNALMQWCLEYVEDGWFRIGNRWSGLFLTTDGADIVHQFANGQYNQQWRLVPVGADPTDTTAPAKPKGVSASANAVSVQLKWKANKEGDLAGYTVLRSTTSGGPYEIIARGLTANAFTDNSANQTMPYYYTVVAVDKSLNRSDKSGETSATPTGEPALVAHYAFECDATDDSINGNDGVLERRADYASGGVGNTCLALVDGYVSLPAEVVNYDQVTIAAWVYWGGGAAWQRIFDFGNGTDEYLFLTPWNGGGAQFTIRYNGVDQNLGAPILAVGQWTHVAVTLGNGSAQLYVGGILADSQPVTIKPSDFNPLINYIGKSQYPDDALVNGKIDDFRIYNHALNAAEVASLAGVSVTDPVSVEAVSWNLDNNGTVGNPDGTYNGDQIAGVVPVVGWHNSWWADPNVNLTDNTGVATTLDISYSSNGGSWTQTGDPGWQAYHPGRDADGTYNNEMLNGYLSGTGYAGTWVSISEIPYDHYDLYVYFASDWASRYGTVTDGTTTYSFNVLDGQAAGSSASLVRTTDTGSGYPEANYAVFCNLSGASQTISTEFLNADGSPGWGGICAFQVVKKQAPVIACSTDVTTLWSPNHTMRDVEITVKVCDTCFDPEDVELTCFVSSSEPDDAEGKSDGSTVGDVDGSDGYTSPVSVDLTFDGTKYVGTVQLRAERDKTGTGRVYTIDCEATDLDTGNASTASCEVVVPLD